MKWKAGTTLLQENGKKHDCSDSGDNAIIERVQLELQDLPCTASRVAKCYRHI